MKRLALLGVLLVAVLAACGGGGGKVGAGTGATTTTSSATSERLQIEDAFQQFFSSSTSPSKRASLLQNGQKFAPVIEAMSKSPLASSTKARVTKVTPQGKTTAKVAYTIYVHGTPALKNQQGGAVLEGGTWKVSDATLCNLIALEGTRPPACKSLGG